MSCYLPSWNLKLKRFRNYCGSAGKESTCIAGDLGSIPGLETSPGEGKGYSLQYSGEGKGYSLQYSGLENSMNYIVHGIAESAMTESLSLSAVFFYK